MTTVIDALGDVGRGGEAQCRILALHQLAGEPDIAGVAAGESMGAELPDVAEAGDTGDRVGHEAPNEIKLTGPRTLLRIRDAPTLGARGGRPK